MLHAKQLQCEIGLVGVVQSLSRRSFLGNIMGYNYLWIFQIEMSLRNSVATSNRKNHKPFCFVFNLCYEKTIGMLNYFEIQLFLWSQ